MTERIEREQFPPRLCPVCRSGVSKALFRQSFDQLSGVHLLDGYDVLVCEECGMGFADGLPPQSVFDEYYRDLVTSNPSPAYIQRVAAVFEDNGEGVRGDMAAVITAILSDPEARAGDEASAAPNSSFGHLREPVLFMANLLRGLDATLGDASTIYTDAPT